MILGILLMLLGAALIFGGWINYRDWKRQQMLDEPIDFCCAPPRPDRKWEDLQ